MTTISFGTDIGVAVGVGVRVGVFVGVAVGGAPPIPYTINYVKENRALEIRPTEPLARFRTVILEILPGVKGTDGGDMLPFKLTFTTGG